MDWMLACKTILGMVMTGTADAMVIGDETTSMMQIRSLGWVRGATDQS